MKHILKPVDAMKLKGRVTIKIATFKTAPAIDGEYNATGTAVRPDWWPFAWPLVVEKRAFSNYTFHDPVTGALLTRSGGGNLKEAVESAGRFWKNRCGEFAKNPAYRIFCSWIEADL